MPRSAARIAVVGAGVVGRQHIRRIAEEANLAGIADPDPAARDTAAQHRTEWFPTLAAMLASVRPDGVVVATPNQLHVENGLACIEAGIPVLVEKPVAADAAEARRLVGAARSRGVALLVGHHRRHSPLVRQAKREVDSRRLGEIVSADALCWLCKPQSYFDMEWRRGPGGGPLLINLIHDVDLMRHLCGDIVAVQAQASSLRRRLAVEDTATVLVRFANGALGTMSVSDAIAAPWSWELTSSENPAYPNTGQSCYRIGGTKGALSIPDLTVWCYEGKSGWTEPLAAERLPLPSGESDPLTLQMRHFCAVALGAAAPLVTGADGLAALEVVEAIRRAAETGTIVELAP